MNRCRRKSGTVVSFVLFLGIFGVLRAFNRAKDEEKFGTVSLVIVGATGDLAKRKIWPSITEMVLHGQIDLSSTHFYAGTRDPEGITRQLISSYFSSLTCPSEWSVNVEKCSKLTTKLMNNIISVQLRNGEDYARLSKIMSKKNEILRVFYLAVPPFAYSDIAEYIHSFCRLEDDLGKLRIAIEKPFGRDFASAEKLAMDLKKFLKDDEIYLVDHYLHKEGVKQIREFLVQNSQLLTPIWNHHHIKHVEIVARESLDVKGRSAFYNHYGVIRDMLQNHLTELMLMTVTAIAIENGENENELKLEFLQKIPSPLVQSSFLGQYYDYKNHLVMDGVIKGSTDNVSFTPTFATVVLYIQDKNWQDVPFYLTSGKALAKREGYVNVVFHSGAFSTFGSENCESDPQISFVFNADKPSMMQQNKITVYPSIPSLLKGNSYDIVETKLDNEAINEQNNCLAQVVSRYNVKHNYSTYSSVVLSLIKGRKQDFVPIANILQSWKIWTPFLDEIDAQKIKSLHLYNAADIEQLNLAVKGTKLQTLSGGMNTFINPSYNANPAVSVSSSNFDISQSSILQHRVYAGTRSDIVLKLASDIYKAAVRAVTTKGSFHMALPGGSSPLDLFHVLSLNYKATFPWQSTHIWQTDERCVDSGSSDSNINQLHQKLLDFVDIPSSNVHAIFPNDVSYKANCLFDSESTQLIQYDTSLNHGMDYVLLGVGRDGHIGSVFPRDAITLQKTIGTNLDLIRLRETYPIKVKERVSMKLDYIIKSNEIALFLTGSNKCNIISSVHKLTQTTAQTQVVSEISKHNLPVYDLIGSDSVNLAVYFNTNSLCSE